MGKVKKQQDTTVTHEASHAEWSRKSEAQRLAFVREHYLPPIIHNIPLSELRKLDMFKDAPAKDRSPNL